TAAGSEVTGGSGTTGLAGSGASLSPLISWSSLTSMRSEPSGVSGGGGVVVGVPLDVSSPGISLTFPVSSSDRHLVSSFTVAALDWGTGSTGADEADGA